MGWRFPSHVDSVDEVTWLIGNGSHYKIKDMTMLSSTDLETFTEEWSVTGLPNGAYLSSVTATKP